MKRLNNNGFMLIEVIIVSTIMMVTMTALYYGFSNTYKAYQIRNSYYDSKTVYALKNFEDFLVDEMILNNISGEYIDIKKDTNNFNETGDVSTYHKDFINNFFNTYAIEKLYLVKYSENNMDSTKNGFAKNMLSDIDLSDYLDFYISNLDSPEYNNYNYILIAKTGKVIYKDSENKDISNEVEEKYSSIRIK